MREVAVVSVASCLLGTLVFACLPEAPAPRGEALVVVDTDAPSPTFVGRMRIDLYAPDGTWVESRDTAAHTAADWPLSFSVYTPDMVHEHVTLLRVRLYPEGETRDYHGERFTSREQTDTPSASAIPPPPDCGDAGATDCELPRLIVNGADQTPAQEPDPYRTIDRLVRIRLQPGVRGRLRLTLVGNCIGTMADMQNLQTCVDQDQTLVDVATPALEADMTIPKAVDRTFGPTVPCPADANPRAGTSKLFDQEVCAPGGTFILGNVRDPEPGNQQAFPLRVATLPPFYMDAYEVTVGRWRDALARGFKPPKAVVSNDTALNRDTCNPPPVYSDSWCTYTTASGVPENREKYPLNCVTWESARAFCQFEGGDLASEAQWEYVVQAVGRPIKSEWPWGSEPPNCIPWATTDRMVTGRLGECAATNWQNGSCIFTDNNPGGQPAVSNHPMCGLGTGRANSGFHAGCGGPTVINPRQGPQPEDAADTPTGDRSFQLGVVNLGGSMEEFMLDSFLPLSSQCWAAAPMVSPVCMAPPDVPHTVRGDAWSGGGDAINRSSEQTLAVNGNAQQIGFRCVRSLQ